jgi:hypothetical protein
MSPEMKRPNVVLLVLDTLRDDYSKGLERLKDMGFLEYRAIAQSSWTLPSHVSMFTSELPSVHGVREYPGIGWGDLMRISRRRMKGDTLLSSLKGRGYRTYGYSSNLFITPQFGFEFDSYHLFNEGGEIKRDDSGAPKAPRVQKLITPFLAEGPVGGFLRWLALGLVGRVMSAAGVKKLEKGSRPILEEIGKTKFEEPFFAFVNLMEAHQPYVWWILDTLLVRVSLMGMPPKGSWWRKSYPLHSGLAVERGLLAVEALLEHDPLIIVVSDHGQLLGDGGRYGHGFSLDQDLVRVPLLIRYPSGSSPAKSVGPVISLAEVKKIVEKTVDGEEFVLGDEFAVSETWGEGNYMRGGAKREQEPNQIFLGRVGGGRTRVTGKEGTVLVNMETGAIEEVTGGLTDEEANELSLKAARGSAQAPSAPADAISPSDEQVVLGRLKQLGYD